MSIILKNTKWTLCFAISILLSEGIFCQVDPVGDFNRHVVESWKGQTIRIGAYNVKGSPYLLTQAHPGSITYRGGETVNNTKVLYDIFLQKAGIEKGNEIYEAPIPIESFTIKLPDYTGGQNLLFKNSYLFGKPDLNLYFNVVEEGPKVILLKTFKLRLVADPINNMDTKSKLFEPYYEYYIYSKATEDLTNFKLKKKDIVKALGDEKFVNSYLSGVDIDLSNEKRVIELVHAYNMGL